MDDNQPQNELYGMTQTWSRYNDYLYSIINQLLSLTYAHKYFGSEETCQTLRDVYKQLYEEINHLKQLQVESNNTNITYIENKKNFNFEKINKILLEILDSKDKIEEVLLEENKSTFSELCPISRNTIIQPVTQKYSDTDQSCDHIFERNNILQFLRNKGAISCPVIGCNKKVAKEYLHRDLELGYFKKKRQSSVGKMVSSALNYANRLKTNNNKGPLGEVELFDTTAQSSKKTSILYDYMSKAEMAIVHTGAGVSTGSGIPDFRGPSGIWTIMSSSKKEMNDYSEYTSDDKVIKKKGRPRKKLTDSNCIPTRNVKVDSHIITRGKIKSNAEKKELSEKNTTQTVDKNNIETKSKNTSKINKNTKVKRQKSINNSKSSKHDNTSITKDSKHVNANSTKVNKSTSVNIGKTNEQSINDKSISNDNKEDIDNSEDVNNECNSGNDSGDKINQHDESGIREDKEGNYRYKLRNGSKCDESVKLKAKGGNKTIKRQKVKLESDESEYSVSSKNEYVVYGNKRRKAVEFILALPSKAHLCLLQLLKNDKIKFIITQNIDGLHALSGVPFDQLSELHGNVFVQRCLHCARRFQRSYVSPTISFHATGDLCGLCSFPPLNLLSDVVLDWFDCYEEHFENISTKKAEEADFHLSLGTSLHIEPACHYASNDYYRKMDSPLVIVNYQNTKLDSESDLIIHDDVNKVCSTLLKKFKIQIPTFKRKSHLIVLKHQLLNNFCVLIIKLSSINSLKVLTGERDSIEYYTSLKSIMDDPLNGYKNGVEWECVNKVQGIYRFTFNKSFGIRLRLFYDTQVVVEIPYERVPLFKGEIWELDICATNGSKLKVVPHTFTQDSFKSGTGTTTDIEMAGRSNSCSEHDTEEHDSTDNGVEVASDYRNVDVEGDGYSPVDGNKCGIHENVDCSKYNNVKYDEVHSDNGCQNNGCDNFVKSDKVDFSDNNNAVNSDNGIDIDHGDHNNNDTDDRTNSDVDENVGTDDENDSVDYADGDDNKVGIDAGSEKEGSYGSRTNGAKSNLIVIHEMRIRYNSHLINEVPFRMVGYLDLINNKSDEYSEHKLPNSLIMLSYLWGSRSIQKVQKAYHSPLVVNEYLNAAKSPNLSFKSDSRSSENSESNLFDITWIGSSMDDLRRNSGGNGGQKEGENGNARSNYDKAYDDTSSFSSYFDGTSIDYFSDNLEMNLSSTSSLSNNNYDGIEYESSTIEFVDDAVCTPNRKVKSELQLDEHQLRSLDRVTGFNGVMGMGPTGVPANIDIAARGVDLSVSGILSGSARMLDSGSRIPFLEHSVKGASHGMVETIDSGVFSGIYSNIYPSLNGIGGSTVHAVPGMGEISMGGAGVMAIEEPDSIDRQVANRASRMDVPLVGRDGVIDGRIVNRGYRVDSHVSNGGADHSFVKSESINQMPELSKKYEVKKEEHDCNSEDILKTYYDNYIKTTSTAYDTPSTSSESDRGTIKKKTKIWKEILDASKMNELIFKKSIRMKLITMKNNKLTASIRSLNVEKYYMSLGSSLPLKLFISKNCNLGYLVERVPEEVVESNKNGNYKHYHRIFNHYELNDLLRETEQDYFYYFYKNLKRRRSYGGGFNAPSRATTDNESTSECEYFGKSAFRAAKKKNSSVLHKKMLMIAKSDISKMNVSVFELMVYNVIRKSCNFSKVENYVITKLFYHHLPLWIVKYLSDLFECR